MQLEIVFTGTGACATGAYATYLTEAGMPCGHERVFGIRGYEHALEKLENPNCKRAESSWLAAPYLDDPVLDGALVVHLVRHPKEFLESAMQTKPGGGRYFMYAARWCPRVVELGRSWDGYAWRYVCWNELIEQKAGRRAYVRWDVAQEPVELIKLLRQMGHPLRVDEQDPVYRRRHINTHRQKKKAGLPQYQFDAGKLVFDDVRRDLERIAERYGYQW